MLSAGEDTRPIPSTVGDKRVAFGQAYLWLCVLISILAAYATGIVQDQFDWISAHFSIMAHNFNDYGLLELGGVPIQNNAPLTNSPDAYLNWPPLFPIILSFVFNIFGNDEVVLYIFATTLNLGTALFIFLIIRRSNDQIAALCAVIAFLSAPVLIRFMHFGLQQHGAYFFFMASLWLFVVSIDKQQERGFGLNRYAWLGCAAFYLGVMCSWEPLVGIFAVFVVALIRWDKPAIGALFMYGMAGALALVTIGVIYGLKYPFFIDIISQRLLIRAGLLKAYAADSYVQQSPHHIHEREVIKGIPSLPKYFVRALFGRIAWMGALGLFAFFVLLSALVLVRRIGDGFQRQVLYVVTAFLGTYVLWAVLMANHFYIHDLAGLPIAPVGALCLGLVVREIRRHIDKFSFGASPTLVYAVLIFAIPTTLLLARIGPTIEAIQTPRAEKEEEAREYAFAVLVRENTETGSIVLWPDRNMGPVYYSQRHVIRGVVSEDIIDEFSDNIAQLCDDCRIYLAFPEEFEGAFPSYLARFATNAVRQDRVGIVLDITDIRSASP